MKLKRSVKRTLQLVVLTLMVVLLVLSTGAQIHRQQSVICPEMQISIDSESGAGFIDESEIKNLLFRKWQDTLWRKPVSDMQTGALEQAILQHPFVEHAAVYIDATGVLQVQVQQRVPMARIINKFGVHYYIDENANKIPISDKFTSRVPVVTGNISENPGNGDTISTQDLKNAYEIISFMNRSDLWKAQLEQLHLNTNGSFEMVPKLGNHVVVLGPPVGIKEKLEKLELFYTEGLGYVGWDVYSRIDVTYADQIVCTKKEWQ